MLYLCSDVNDGLECPECGVRSDILTMTPSPGATHTETARNVLGREMFKSLVLYWCACGCIWQPNLPGYRGITVVGTIHKSDSAVEYKLNTNGMGQ